MNNTFNNQPNKLLAVSYETSLGTVNLCADDVVRYLARGGAALTEGEIKMFLELCKYQKLNPFIGEAYAIKFGGDFQLVVGYETYKRRAEENPSYIGRKSGIVIFRGKDIVKKEGTCVYPQEELIGGWCRVFRDRNGKTDETYKEVSLSEYDKKQANWKTKPATMIEKVAVSQALRAAFPTDYQGLYTAEDTGVGSSDENNLVLGNNGEIINISEEVITQSQRAKLFSKAKEIVGDNSNNEIKRLLNEFGYSSTNGLPVSIYEQILQKLDDLSPVIVEDYVEAEQEELV